MTGLTIGRLAADVVAPGRTDPDRVDRLLRRLAERTLDERRAGLHDLSGHWCVRRIDLEITLDAGEPDTAAAQRWADLIAASVRGLTADGTAVVHYPHRGGALAELVRSIPAGRVERVWAWRQLGLLTADDPDPLSDPAGALLAAVGREPDLTVASLVHAVRTGGIGPLHRVLGEVGWTALARNVAPDLPVDEPRAQPQGRGAPEPAAPPIAPPDAPAAAHRARARDVLTGSTLLAAARAGAPDPSPRTLAAWAVLGTAEVEPHRPELAAAVTAALRDALRTGADAGPAEPLRPPGRAAVTMEEPGTVAAGAPSATATAPTPRPPRRAGLGEPTAHSEPPVSPPAAGAGRAAGEVEGSGAGPAATPAVAAGADPAAGEPYPAAHDPIHAGPDPDNDPGRRPAADTAWAGLLFLLNTALAAGVPDALDADVRLADRPLRWTLHQIAQRLVPVAATDPAALAVAGLAPDAALPAGDEPTGPEQGALAEHAARWAACTVAAAAHAADPDEGGPPTVWSLARRPGTIVADPGWLEVHLALDDVDMTVRRAGLDVDPGWLGWLGTVVRFCYG